MINPVRGFLKGDEAIQGGVCARGLKVCNRR